MTCAVVALVSCRCSPAVAAPRAKDAQAVAVLAQMAASTGWVAGSLPTDGVATGTLARVTQGTTVSVTYKVRGSNQLREEIQDSTSLTTVIFSGGPAASILSDGTLNPLGIGTTLSAWPDMLPLFSTLATASRDPSVSLVYEGPENVNAATCQKIQIVSQVDPGDPLASAKAMLNTMTIWVDSTTGLPAQIQYAQLATDNPTVSALFVRQFSNYQMVGTLLIPFTQQEYLNGQLLLTLQLSQVSFNVGLTDADFTIPSGQ